MISIFLYKKNIPLSINVHVHWMNLIKNQILQKYESFEILKERVVKQRAQFFLAFDKIIMFNGFKMSNFKCRSHVQEIILLKNMFSCPLTFILGFLRIFCIFGYKSKYSYKIMDECEKLTIVTWIILNWTNQFFSFKFVSSKCYLWNVAPQKSKNPFSFFGYPNYEWTLLIVVVIHDMFFCLSFFNKYEFLKMP